MSRYIDADKIIETLEKAKQCNKEMCHILLMDEDDMIAFIKKQPTADVEEVKHGKWIGNKNSGDVFCSNCDWNIDTFYHHIDITEFEYCPSCKAKMDLE